MFYLFFHFRDQEKSSSEWPRLPGSINRFYIRWSSLFFSEIKTTQVSNRYSRFFQRKTQTQTHLIRTQAPETSQERLARLAQETEEEKGVESGEMPREEVLRMAKVGGWGVVGRKE